jgi:dolichyl-phosphate-mannose--protein O-mannosyl transferase
MNHKEIQFGERIKIRDIVIGKSLHSYNINYTISSRKQEVTGYYKRDYNYW